MEGKETTKKLEAKAGAADVGTAALLAPLLAYKGDERVRKGYELFQKLYKKEFANVSVLLCPHGSPPVQHHPPGLGLHARSLHRSGVQW